MSLKQHHQHRRTGLKKQGKTNFTQSRWGCLISWLFGSWQKYTRPPVHRRTHTTGIIYLCVFLDCRRKHLSLRERKLLDAMGRLIMPCKSHCTKYTMLQKKKSDRRVCFLVIRPWKGVTIKGLLTLRKLENPHTRVGDCVIELQIFQLELVKVTKNMQTS